MESEKGLVWALRKAEGSCVQRPGGACGDRTRHGGTGESGGTWGPQQESGQALVAVLQASPSTSFVSTDKERCTSQLLSSRRPPGPWGWWRGPQSAPVISIFCAELSVHDLRRHFPPSPAIERSVTLSSSHPCFSSENPGLGASGAFQDHRPRTGNPVRISMKSIVSREAAWFPVASPDSFLLQSRWVSARPM